MLLIFFFLHIILEPNEKLSQLLPEIDKPVLEVWLVVHPDVAKIPRIRTIMNFIAEKAMRNPSVLLTGLRPAR